tara:strand:+ start:265 stop:492 length:228 start_codon:yes stop_codon:yes gene_type:complete
MDIKSMLMQVAENQASEMQNEIAAWLQSEEFEEKLANALDSKINIPFVKDEKEAEIFRDFVDVVTDIVSGLIGRK